MRAYLEAMDRALVIVPEPAEPPVRVLGALGPRMIELSGELAQGAHPYNMTPEHTAMARSILGSGPIVAPEQALVLESDPDSARATGRRHLAIYLDLPNYRNSWLRLGFTEADLADGGSDRLIDAVVAWGDVDALADRVRAHLDAGANHVCVQVLPASGGEAPVREWRELAPALLSM
jgi:probable F420-dependent oxidoreductase